MLYLYVYNVWLLKLLWIYSLHKWPAEKRILELHIADRKSDMNSDVPLEKAAIFFLANLYLKQGISRKYVMVDFICMWLLDLRGARTENYKMKFFLPTEGFEPGTFR